jgi:hypothetical protein
MGIAAGHVNAGVPQHGAGGYEIYLGDQQGSGRGMAKVMLMPMSA